jgi:hypothetical protein
MSADEGAKEMLKSSIQQATKLVKEKVDKQKEAKKEKVTGKGKRKATAPEKVKMEIPPKILEVVKLRLQKRKQEQKPTKPKVAGMLKVAEEVLPHLKKFRSIRPVFWDPRKLVPADRAHGAVRDKVEEHERELTEKHWAEREQPSQKEWLVFQFNVSFFFFQRYHIICRWMKRPAIEFKAKSTIPPGNNSLNLVQPISTGECTPRPRSSIASSAPRARGTGCQSNGRNGPVGPTGSLAPLKIIYKNSLRSGPGIMNI